MRITASCYCGWILVLMQTTDIQSREAPLYALLAIARRCHGHSTLVATYKIHPNLSTLPNHLCPALDIHPTGKDNPYLQTEVETSLFFLWAVDVLYTLYPSILLRTVESMMVLLRSASRHSRSHSPTNLWTKILRSRTASSSALIIGQRDLMPRSLSQVRRAQFFIIGRCEYCDMFRLSPWMG